MSYKSPPPYRSGAYKRDKKEVKKSIVFDEKWMKPDPNFTDERVVKSTPKEGWMPRFRQWFQAL